MPVCMDDHDDQKTRKVSRWHLKKNKGIGTSLSILEVVVKHTIFVRCLMITLQQQIDIFPKKLCLQALLLIVLHLFSQSIAWKSYQEINYSKNVSIISFQFMFINKSLPRMAPVTFAVPLIFDRKLI